MAEKPEALISLTADIVAAYVSHNNLITAELPTLISTVHQALGSAGQPAEPAEPEALKLDKATIRKSIHHDYLVSFIDGRQFKSLKRHLSTIGITTEEYRTRYGLPKDYPMVAPSYSAKRSELAKSLGLGRRAAPAPAAKSLKPKGKPGPTAKAAVRPEDETFT